MILGLLGELTVQAPVLLVALVGMVLALVMIQRSTAAAVLALLGGLLLLVQGLLEVVAYILPALARVSFVYGLAGHFVATVLFAVGFLMLAVGAGVGRARTPPRAQPPPPPMQQAPPPAWPPPGAGRP